MKKELDKNLFEFVEINENSFEEKFETKPISSIKDSVIRFSRNKSSVVAFFILLTLILLTIFAPIFSKIKDKSDPTISNLPPKVALLSRFGIFDGTKKFSELVLEDASGQNVLYDIYPQESIIWMSEPKEKSFGIDNKGNEIICKVVDIKVDLYKIAFGNKVVIVGREEYNDLVTKEGVIIKVIQFVEFIKNDVDYSQYELEVNYAKYLGLEGNPRFLFGTDQNGRDLWYLLWRGARTSFIFAITVAIINITIGIIYGSLAGYYGGPIDQLLSRLIEVIVNVPGIVIITVVTAHLGRGMIAFIVSFILTGWIGIAAITRAQFYRFKGREYVLASRTLGAKDHRLIFKHILPNGLGTIVTRAVLMVPSLIVAESGLAFLGIGLDNANTVGVLLNRGYAVITSNPHLTLYPAAFIGIMMISFNLFGNGLRDALNPALRGVE